MNICKNELEVLKEFQYYAFLKECQINFFGSQMKK